MRKLVVTEFMSLDGVMESPGGENDFPYGAWTIPYWNDAIGEFKTEELRAADALLVGRVTYEVFAGAWPGRAGDPFADKMNSMEKYLVSSTTEAPTWENTTVVRFAEIASLKERDGDDILVAGSQTLVQALLAERLVDEVRLVMYPVALGTGRRVFGDDAGHNRFDLVGSATADNGVLLLTYGRSDVDPGKVEFPSEA